MKTLFISRSYFMWQHFSISPSMSSLCAYRAIAMTWMVTIYSCHLSITLFANCFGNNFRKFPIVLLWSACQPYPINIRSSNSSNRPLTTTFQRRLPDSLLNLQFDGDGAVFTRSCQILTLTFCIAWKMEDILL